MPVPNNISQPSSIIHTNKDGSLAAGVATAPPVSGTDAGLQVFANLGSAVIPVQQSLTGSALMATGQAALNSSTATLVIAARPTRRSALVTNTSASINVWVGNSGVTNSTGQLIAPGNSLTIPSTVAVYAISASATPTVTTTEVYD